MTDEQADSTTEESEPQTDPADADAETEPDPDHETSDEVGADDEPTEPA
jgi:hypothetical protein